MSKITIDGLTRSAGTGCFIAVPIRQHCGRQRVKKEKDSNNRVTFMLQYAK